MNEIREGMVIYSADGEKLGKVVRVDANGFIIEKGLFFPKDYFVRFTDVANIRGRDDNEATLRISKAELRPLREQAEPPLPATAESTVEEARIPLKEEEIVVGKESREAGRVVVKKEVVTEQKQVTVPVTHEEVRVERVPASGARADEPFEEEEVAVSLREEKPVVGKRSVVREEVRVTKQPVTEQRSATETVRREEAEVESEGDVRRVPGSEDDKRHL